MHSETRVLTTSTLSNSTTPAQLMLEAINQQLSAKINKIFEEKVNKQKTNENSQQQWKNLWAISELYTFSKKVVEENLGGQCLMAGSKLIITQNQLRQIEFRIGTDQIEQNKEIEQIRRERKKAISRFRSPVKKIKKLKKRIGLLQPILELESLQKDQKYAESL